MKKITLILLSVLISILADAQSIALVKMQEGFFETTYKNKELPVCPLPDKLQEVSNQMFNEGNPKYIWVDLLIDQIIEENQQYNLYIYTESKNKGGNVLIPDRLRKQYAKKWALFVSSVGEKVVDNYHMYAFGSVKDKSNGIASKDLLNPESEFRKITKPELYLVGLNSRGKLKFYREIAADGLANPSEPFEYHFSSRGYYINGKRLNNAMHEKYRAMCLEEFGWDGDKQWGTADTNDRKDSPTLNSRIQREMDRIVPLTQN